MCSVDTSSARQFATVGRWSRGFAVVLLVFGLFVSLSVTPCMAGQGTDITKVDEYWEMDLNTPNSVQRCPAADVFNIAHGNDRFPLWHLRRKPTSR